MPKDNLILLLLVFLMLILLGFVILLNQKNKIKSNYYQENLKRLKGENDIINKVINQIKSDSQHYLLEKNTLQKDIEFQKTLIQQLKVELKDAQHKIFNLENEKNELTIQLQEEKIKNQQLAEQIKKEKIQLNELQNQFKTEFENLANVIIEEKSKKFTRQNQENLDAILKPFQEKMIELKNTVHASYEKESKERFSLGEKVKELAELNQQISEDAKKLTKALKSESKTQGNWGEMILENILEKSGLVKGREFFMEHELKDENNQAIYSEFSGKKMRPDAVVKYPDNRNVIIDSKVSLTAFLETIDETDSDLIEIKIQQHLQSIKNHIHQLSQKAYDDFDKSLDFVMMFVPSESAYIAAMQADPDLWNYAYKKRILLLNPTNLITSLKLLADLWKREYQNKNAMQIAEKGAKLYDKFVLFVQNLDEVGKQINKAQETYQTAYKQLHTGRNNLIKQAQNLKELGVKTTKNLSATLVHQAKTSDKDSNETEL